MTEILLIRHGETEWNAKKRLQGHLDIPLNAEGRQQAAALGRTLLHEPLDAIIASDLERAKQTAQAIAAPRNMAVRIDPGLRERCYGAFEGLSYGEIQERYPEAYVAWRMRAMDARFPLGTNRAETLREFSERAVGTLLRIARLKYAKVAVVAHGGVLECVYRVAQGTGFSQPRDFDILNASINRLTWDGVSLQILQWGDISHLASKTTAVLDEVDK